MIPLVAHRGWNYHGTVSTPDGSQPMTYTLYAETADGDTQSLVLFEATGTQPDAFSGTQVASSPLSLALLAVPSRFVEGTTTALLPTLVQTVTSVGTVPGASACPSPKTGATVTYSDAIAQAASYTIALSFVPGCGITAISGDGMSLQLASVSTYSGPGKQAVTRSGLTAAQIPTGNGFGTIMLRARDPLAMPDVNDTERYAGIVADLIGRHAGANGRSFEPSADGLAKTGGAGSIAFIEKRLAAHTTLSQRDFARYACAFGVDAAGSGHLEHGRNIGQLWVSGVPGACTTPMNYVDFGSLAREAVDALTR